MNKIIELNGIKYKEVPAKTNDKICKTCDYFWDNRKRNLGCDLEECPCKEINMVLKLHELKML